MLLMPPVLLGQAYPVIWCNLNLIFRGQVHRHMGCCMALGWHDWGTTSRPSGVGVGEWVGQLWGSQRGVVCLCLAEKQGAGLVLADPHKCQGYF